MSIVLVESFRWTAFWPNTRLHSLKRVSVGSSASGDVEPHPPNTPPPSDLLQDKEMQPYFLSDRWDEDKAFEGKAEGHDCSMSNVVQEISPPDPALGAVVNAGTQEENYSSVSKDLQAGIAVVSETIVKELIVSWVHNDLHGSKVAGTHSRVITETSFEQ